MKFDIIEILKNIEETRFIFGKKLEKAFFYIFSYFLDKIKVFFKAISRKDNFVFYFLFFVAFLSLFLRFNRDIGFESAFFIEIANNIIEGKNVNQKIFENHSFLAIYFLTIPVFFAKILKINPIFAVEFFMNLIAILFFFISYKLMIYGSKTFENKGESLVKSSISVISKTYRFYKSHIFYLWQKFTKNDVLQNSSKLNFDLKLMLFSFISAYFLRFYTMQFNEYFTQASWFLLFSFLYLICNFSNFNSVKIQILKIVLASAVIALKANYIFFILAIEFVKIYEKFQEKNRIQSLYFQNFAILIFAFLINNFVPIFNFNFNQEIFKIVKYDFFASFLLIILFFDEIKKIKFYRYFLATIFSLQFLNLFANENIYDQRFLPFAFVFYIFGALFLKIFKSQKNYFQKNWILCFLIIVIVQFDAKSSFELIFNLCYFLWILLFFRKKFQPILSFFVASLIVISFLIKNQEIIWIIYGIITILILRFAFFHKRNLPLLLVLSYFLSIFLSSIFGFENIEGKNLKTPNLITQNIQEIIAKNLEKNQNFLMISDEIQDFYPVFLYSDLKNQLNYLDFKDLFANIENNKFDENFLDFFQDFQKSKPEIIFVKKNAILNDRCLIDFLEFYFRNKEFKEFFNANYRFLTNVYDEFEVEKISDITQNNLHDVEIFQEKFKINKFEVYLKNGKND